ncbi:unnamed protein product [Effrenium voratum]|uniref:Uncharacterized protein n=1 Tax=Effrenium voratum TaxID=2562239 RepID=A0AA36J3T5_9DINO|nr:unnamed protein product [Effrenium voratum]CAJ1455029.1 unnamed protein product [Effrenium voratum]
MTIGLQPVLKARTLHFTFLLVLQEAMLRFVLFGLVWAVVASDATSSCPQSSTSSALLQRRVAFGEAMPPIGFAKVHKTGGSTLAGIFFRLAELANSTIMLPACEDNKRLGHPFAFPGEHNLDLHGPPAHQFDMILNHAVLNPVAFASYLKPTPFFVSILREPKAQVASTYNFYRIKFGKWNSTKEYLASLETQLEKASKGRRVRQFINFQSYDLGFYEAGGMPNSTSSEVSEWIASLDKTFSFPSAGLMLITEYFDEGLALLKGRLNVALPALTYTIQKDYQHNESLSYEDLNDTEMSWVLKHAANVDMQLYHHFNRTFAKVWSKRGSSVDSDLRALQDANAALSKDCEATPPGPLCEKFATSDPDRLLYANLFRARQGLKECNDTAKH